MGRKPIPTKIKEIKGTKRKSNTLRNEFDPETVDALPEPPEWLPELASDEWRRITKELKTWDMLAETDLAVLSIYCNEYYVYISMEQEMRRLSRVMIYRDESGKVKHIQPVAYQTIATGAMRKMLAIATEFGFTPASRTKVSTDGTKKKTEKDNPFILRKVK